MTSSTVCVPAFRKPWENGARAYFEADTVDAALEGFRRKRKDELFHIPNVLPNGNASEASKLPCTSCGIALGEVYPVNRGGSQLTERPDINSTWKYLAKSKQVVGGVHYYCSWGQVMEAIHRLGNPE